MSEWNPSTRETRLWCIQDGEPLLQFWTEVRSIDVSDKVSVPWTCGKCGRVNAHLGNCESCGAPFFSRAHQGEIVIATLWRHAHQLSSFQNGDVLEIVAKRCGRPDEYFDEEVIVRLRRPKVVRTWVDHPVIMYSGDAQMLMFCQEIKGEITFLTDQSE